MRRPLVNLKVLASGNRARKRSADKTSPLAPENLLCLELLRDFVNLGNEVGNGMIQPEGDAHGIGYCGLIGSSSQFQ